MAETTDRMDMREEKIVCLLRSILTIPLLMGAGITAAEAMVANSFHETLKL